MRPLAWRAPEGRASRIAWRPWVRAVADELRAMGRADRARRLLSCGAVARVWTCGGCGDPHARVEVSTSCDSRVCPWCARREATERTRLVRGAVARVPGYVMAQAPARLASIDARRAQLAGLRPTEARELERRLHTRAHHAIVGRDRWRWRLVTVSPAWSPSSPADYTVAGLRRRVDAAREAWRALWDCGLSAGGLAAAYARVECSSGGHVHVHVAYYGPWVPRAWARGVAGCFVDVRELDARGLREAVKYSLKAPSITRALWIGGATTRVAHPRLAARWALATHRQRLAEAFGVMRDAISAELVCGEQPSDAAPPPVACASCGCADLVAPRDVATARVARELVARARALSRPHESLWTHTAERTSIGRDESWDVRHDTTPHGAHGELASSSDHAARTGVRASLPPRIVVSVAARVRVASVVVVPAGP